MTELEVPGAEAHVVTIFHNPSCSNSRTALGILRDQSVDHAIVEYLVAPPSRETLEMIVSKLIDPIPDLIRTTDKRFLELGLDPGLHQCRGCDRSPAGSPRAHAASHRHQGRPGRHRSSRGTCGLRFSHRSSLVPSRRVWARMRS